MRTKLFLLIFTVVLFSSGFIFNPLSDYKKYILKNSDSAEIKFYAYKEARTDIKKQFTFKTKEEIKKILDFISDKTAPFYKGGYNGSIDFLKNGKSILEEKIEFNLSKDMRHIVFLYKKKLYSRKLTENGIKFLNELSNKNTFMKFNKIKTGQ